MLAFAENGRIVTAELNDAPELDTINYSASSFRLGPSRFYRIIDTDVVRRDIRHLTKGSMQKEAINIFRLKSKEHNSYEFNEKDINMGYKVFPELKMPTVFTYMIMYPAITEFFILWNSYKNGEEINYNYDLSKLFYNMNNFSKLVELFEKEGNDLRLALYSKFPQFAIFYYEIYPYLRPIVTGNYEKEELYSLKDRLIEEGKSTKYVESLISSYDVALNNTEVLKLIKDNKINLK